METQQLIKHVAELEARVNAMNNLLSNVINKNDLKLPPIHEMDRDLVSYKSQSNEKYGIK